MSEEETKKTRRKKRNAQSTNKDGEERKRRKKSGNRSSGKDERPKDEKKPAPQPASIPDATDLDAETQKLLAAAEAKKKESQSAMRNLTPIQQPVKEKEKKSRFGFGFRKKKKEAEIGGIIAGSVKHEGHAGFEEGGGLSTKGLPPELAEFFQKLDQLFRKLGYDGVTQQEVSYVLKEFGDVIVPKTTPKPPTPAPVKIKSSSSDGDYKALLEQYNSQNAVLNGLKMTHTTIQTAKAKLKDEVEELNEILAKERATLKEQMEKNTTLEVEVARLRSSGGDVGEGSDAFTELENRMKAKMEELSNRLTEEQGRTKALQSQLDQFADEKAQLLARLGESEEILKQNREALSNRSNNTKTSTPKESYTSVGPPPDTPAPPPPPPPPMNVPPPPSGGANKTPSSGGGFDLSAVKLNKTAPVEKQVDSQSELLAQIRTGTALKKVDHEEKKAVEEEDDGNILNIIAKRLLDRRNGIDMDDDEEDSWDNGDDEDWE